MSKNKKNSAALHIATPFIMLLLCVGILAAALVKPADKLKMLLNVAFMDSFKADSDETGLVIRPNEIVTDYEGETSTEGKVKQPKFGEQFAVLSTKALATDVPVYYGSGAELLEHGACMSSDSSVPGKGGNAVVSAHVDTFFADLDKLKVGDKVTISTNYGKFTYEVSELISFADNNTKYVKQTKDDRLTVYTCTKELLGNSNSRIGAVCKLTEKAFYVDEKEGE